MLMLPREHGAYSQMVLPLVTTFLVSGVTLAAALTGVAVVLGFLAHEPLMVLLGRRGARVRTESAGRARSVLMMIGAAMTVVGIAAVVLAPPAARPWFVLPLVPAMVVAAGVLRKHEKSGPAEIAVALAFSLTAAPIAVAAGAAVVARLAPRSRRSPQWRWPVSAQRRYVRYCRGRRWRLPSPAFSSR
jgi:hypothetical protein